MLLYAFFKTAPFSGTVLYAKGGGRQWSKPEKYLNVLDF